jgi:hypothetical protein
MFVIYNKNNGYVKIATTEDPENCLQLKEGWEDNYATAEFPLEDIENAYDILFKVEGGSLVPLGTLKEIEADPELLAIVSASAPDLM